MLISIAGVLMGVTGLRWLLGGVFSSGGGGLVSDVAAERGRLRQVVALLRELEESLAAGLVPAEERWAALRSLPKPWGTLASDSLLELRTRGGALLPTLRRMRELAQGHDASLGEAQARSSQALAQALVCALLVPVFGAVLYAFLPALEESRTSWIVACFAAVAWAGIGAAWMLRLADSARWGGLPKASRPWVLAAQCAGERFLALVKSGSPADLAWVRASALLGAEAPGLASLWGANLWRVPERSEGLAGAGPRVSDRAPAALRALAETGSSLRKAVQVSLMEGRPCAERAETALQALRQEMGALVERELGLLAARSLKPLFLCVAPAIFGLLGTALALTWSRLAGGGADGGF